ncbi:zinc finger A20 and AN1 domain-containing protein [Cinnamomum micranthum f. kanehirae]|uniref:Zinc finger A20 and AN1 domain-containing protein n=1 Tax=Cinnamomum micranthum f. kanehirae TaxID=337451 RepID=A0A3S3NAB9_9MAGN|nr:zinc finger A20 and AN1 domain-containing protein [Cinnamomum micranthum f. kanehirae]
MEQETSSSCASPSDPILCPNNCGFFGNASNYNLCSKCYKDFLREKSHAITNTVVEKKGKVEEKCRQTFCSIHRFAEEHGCSFDYKKRGKDEITRDNPLVRKDKIQRF